MISPRQVVVVDDSRAMRKLMTRMIGSMGFSTLEADNGQHALDVIEAAIESGPPDVVMADWNMPEMNGLELVRHLRADARLDGVRILMVTSESEIDRIEEALVSGADEYLMKPFDKEALAEKLVLLGCLGEGIDE
ncbi:response regulator [Acidiferrimicrobium sp. IK]|uniref:response regulator n=1 Tax=Acidiferrimicrobium sp. IK TaxID=2871700 RepID=UPI0021CB9A06|nr:response regulator [Acidiferrimicrobium sp. IK]MCU4182818.1 response regulator [Acidiferrimicrobium sp. IK]